MYSVPPMDEYENLLLNYIVWGNVTYKKKCPKRFWDDRDAMIRVLKKAPLAFQYIPKKYHKDKEIVCIIVERDGLALQYFNPFWDDRDVVKIAVANNGRALLYASNLLKLDKSLVLMAVANGLSLQNVPQIYSQNREVFMTGVTYHGMELKYVPKPLLDEKMVYAAVTQNGDALQFADIKSRDNEKIVLAALQNKYSAGSSTFIKKGKNRCTLLQFISKRLKSDKQFALKAILYGVPLVYFSNEIRNDLNIPSIVSALVHSVYHFHFFV